MAPLSLQELDRSLIVHGVQLLQTGAVVACGMGGDAAIVACGAARSRPEVVISVYYHPDYGWIPTSRVAFDAG